jgi:hypothetical protein
MSCLFHTLFNSAFPGVLNDIKIRVMNWERCEWKCVRLEGPNRQATSIRITALRPNFKLGIHKDKAKVSITQGLYISCSLQFGKADKQFSLLHSHTWLGTVYL